MKLFSKIVAKVKEANDLRQKRQELRNLMIEAAQDGKLTDQEINDIESKCEELGLPREEIVKLSLEVFQIALRAVKADRRLTDDEAHELTKITTYFNISEQAIQSSQEELSRYRLLYYIEQGYLPTVEATNLILRGDEVAHWIEPASMLEERVTKRYYAGGSSGASIRVAKGFSFRVGSSRGTLHTERGIVPISSGRLIITSKRIVFSGEIGRASCRERVCMLV